MKIVTLFLLTIMTNLFMLCTAHAFYMPFMRTMPLNYFTKQDFAMANATVFKALDKANDGQKMTWQNPQSGAFGYAMPSDSHDNCRRLKIFNSAQGVKSMTNYQFCKVQGEWKIVY